MRQLLRGFYRLQMGQSILVQLSLYFERKKFFTVSDDRDADDLMLGESLFHTVAILLFINCSSSVDVIDVLWMS